MASLASTACDDQTQKCKRSYRFFFDHPDLFLKVENTLFKVPSFYFRRESKVFRDLYHMPKAGDVDGSSEEHPLFLSGVRARDMECVFRVMFPSSLRKEDELTADQWESVMKLSHLWDMESLLYRAAENLERLLHDSPAYRYSLAKRYDITRWVRPAIEQLVMRSKPISVHDVDTLNDIDLVLKICELRESCQRGYFPNSDWYIRNERGSIPDEKSISPAGQGSSGLPNKNFRERMEADFSAWWSAI